MEVALSAETFSEGRRSSTRNRLSFLIVWYIPGIVFVVYVGHAIVDDWIIG